MLKSHEMLRILVAALCTTCFALSASAQSGTPVPKRTTAVRTASAPAIDGSLNDEAWQAARPATDFVELRPVPGRLEPRDRATEVRILYDDVAVYVGARMFYNPDSIAREVAERDQVGNADFIGVIFDTYYDKINATGFYVTAANSQFDAKYSGSGNEDPNWNAVWLSKVKRDDKGWTAEMKIPYSALRFARKDVQLWGINFTRRNQFTQVQTFWNFVDPKKNGFINQEGELDGLTNVEPPIRLSFSPYISGYVNNYPHPVLNNTTGTFNGGMDVKYGLTDAFTLDMTLVPDFGQVQSDNRILNLSPFEVQYNENRQFFTEGTELFSKGDLFYSRRIGASPINASAASAGLLAGERIVNNPSETRLINATKVSGRTAKQLGVGFFNALTRRTFATVEDDQGNRRSVETAPLTNYNILVLDQSLKNNSYVTLINTNVTRQGKIYDANASGLLFSLNDKKNLYNLSGSARSTHLNDRPGNTGYSYSLSAGKQSGSFIAYLEESVTDSKFNPNDLGILFQNNFWNHHMNLGYNIFKPGKWYNTIQTWSNLTLSQRYAPRSYQYFRANAGGFVKLKKLHSLEFNVNYRPEANDYFEPRSTGSVFRKPGYLNFNGEFTTNRAKRYNSGLWAGIYDHSRFDGFGSEISWFQNFRVNNKLAFGNDIYYDRQKNTAGWIASSGGVPVFSVRDRKTIENSLDAKYTFSENMGLTLVVRHYWSALKNNAFYTLQTDGSLAPNPGFTQNKDRTFNTFNIDMVYSWVFSPGSVLSIVYKDASSFDENGSREGYFRNFSRVTGAPQNNNLSVKILYFIDYLQLKNRKNMLK